MSTHSNAEKNQLASSTSDGSHPELKVTPDAPGDAALDAARDAALDAAGDATRDAARDATRDAAGDATQDAAGDATRDAAGDQAVAWAENLLAKNSTGKGSSAKNLSQRSPGHALLKTGAILLGIGVASLMTGLAIVFSVYRHMLNDWSQHKAHNADNVGSSTTLGYGMLPVDAGLFFIAVSIVYFLLGMFFNRHERAPGLPASLAILLPPALLLLGGMYGAPLYFCALPAPYLAAHIAGTLALTALGIWLSAKPRKVGGWMLISLSFATLALLFVAVYPAIVMSLIY